MVHALIPVKSLDRAKGRLAPLLAPEERRALVLAMLDDVLAVLATSELATITVLPNDPHVRAAALQAGAQVVDDNAGELNLALREAVHTIELNDRARLLVLFADLPLLTAHELAVFLALGKAVDVGLAASRDGGTNALMAGVHALPFSFGPNSLARHMHAATKRGLRTTVVRLPGMERDVDRPEDVIWLAGQGGTTATAKLVRALGIGERTWEEVVSDG